MINGERETGFTYHYIDEQCDTGPVILQRKVAIERWDTQLSLYNKVMFESMKYFHEVVELVANGHEGMKQEGESSYYPRGCPFGGVINPEWDAAFIKRFIRAMHHPPLPPATFSGREIHSFDDYLKARAELADEKSM